MTVYRDPSLPHQIVLKFRPRNGNGTQEIAVSCNCGTILASRPQWDDPGEPMRIWRAHLAQVAA